MTQYQQPPEPGHAYDEPAQQRDQDPDRMQPQPFQPPQYGYYPGAPDLIPPPAAAKPPAKKANIPIIVVSALATLLVGGVIAAAATASPDTDTDRPTIPERNEPAAPVVEEPEPEPAVPNAEGEIGGVCDLLLHVDDNFNSDFAASIDVTNIGNIGIVVEVTAAFDQLGQDDYVLSDTVEVAVGETETVHLNERIDHATVDRHQDGGYECRLDGEITDTFGEVQD